MTTGSSFGRRGSTSAPAIIARKRAATPGEAPAVEPLPDSEQADPRASRRAMLHMARVSGVAVAGLVGLWLVSGSMGSVDLDKIGPKTKPEAPQTAQGAPAVEPSSTPAQDEPQTPPEQLQKASAKAVAEEQRTAALQFFAFYHLNTRIRTAFCANHGVDMTVFASQFRQSQRANHARATAVAAAAGLTEERIFADSRAELNGLIDADMEQLGRKTGMGAAGGCRLMVRHADQFVPGIDFAKVMPDAHRALMGASRT